MTIATPKSLTPGEPPHRRWTRREYLRLAELGFFDGERVELVDGEIIQMSPVHNAHSAVLTRLTRAFHSLDENRFWVRTQATLDLGENLPEPDLAIVRGPASEGGTFPTAAMLVVEISDTTLKFDRGEKMSLYAAGGVPEYWIVNIPDRCIEVYRQPVNDPGQPYGHRYGDVRNLVGDSALSPLFESSFSFSVNQIIR